MTGDASAGLTATLAARAVSLSFPALPPPVVELVRQCLLDYLAVSLAGADDLLVTMLLDEEKEAAGAPQAGVIGQRDRLPALAAALVNGAAGHALDYDDVNMTIPGHPTAALFAALFAQAEAGERVAGPALITAFVRAMRPPAASAPRCSRGIMRWASTPPARWSALAWPPAAAVCSGWIPPPWPRRWASPARRRPG